VEGKEKRVAEKPKELERERFQSMTSKRQVEGKEKRKECTEVESESEGKEIENVDAVELEEGSFGDKGKVVGRKRSRRGRTLVAAEREELGKVGERQNGEE
jgi:hypothetical protein